MNNQSNKREEKSPQKITRNTTTEDYLVRDYSKPNFQSFKPSNPAFDYGTFN